MADLLLLILAILLPPVAVFLHQNACNIQVIINLLFCIFIPYLGGIIHALWVITR